MVFKGFNAARAALAAALILSFSALSGCVDDLSPDDKDLRDEQQQRVSDFTVRSTLNQPLNLTQLLNDKDAVVLYFTMWCSLCNYHMEYIDSHFVANYPNVRFVMVDYVSGSISSALSAQQQNNYVGSTVIADSDDLLQDLFDGTMASVIVIGNNRDDADNPGHPVLLNEDFKDGQRLAETLDQLASENNPG